MDYNKSQNVRIILAFTAAYQIFRALFVHHIHCNLGARDTEKVKDEIYRRLIADICLNLLEPLKNKYMHVQSFDNSGNYQSIIDAFIFNVSSLTGYQLGFDRAHEIVIRVETAAIEDICEFIPYIDDSSQSVEGYQHLAHNSILINIKLHNGSTTDNQFR